MKNGNANNSDHDNYNDNYDNKDTSEMDVAHEDRNKKHQDQ